MKSCFSRNLRYLRIESGMRQIELAEMLGYYFIGSYASIFVITF